MYQEVCPLFLVLCSESLLFLAELRTRIVVDYPHQIMMDGGPMIRPSVGDG